DVRGAALDVNASSRISGNAITFYNNMAVAASGGAALGGAMEVQFACAATLQNVIALNNSATTNQGTGLGGAFAAEDATLDMTNTVVADNSVQITNQTSQPTATEGGGGMLLQGMVATITQSTFANNHLSANLLDGQAILLTNGGPYAATATIADSIIADHTN